MLKVVTQGKSQENAEQEEDEYHGSGTGENVLTVCQITYSKQKSASCK